MSAVISPKAKRQTDAVRAWALDVLAQTYARGFYGKITLVFEGGKISRIVKEESLKPPVANDSMCEGSER